MSKEAMKLALEAFESLKVTVSNRTEANVIDGVDLFPKQMAALQKALANEALGKMAENARELGLDYEPAQQEPVATLYGSLPVYDKPAQKPQRWAVFCQGCRKEWSVSYPHPGKDICVDCDDKPAQPEPVACQYAQDVAMPEYRCVGRCQYDTSPPAQQEPVAHAVIAGALFDFMGWLTSRKERLVLSSADNASPAVGAITEFAKMRGLSLNDAKVQDWNTSPPAQRKPLTDEEIEDIWADCPVDWDDKINILTFARAIEAAHGIKENT